MHPETTSVVQASPSSQVYTELGLLKGTETPLKEQADPDPTL
jgi:hypothetical protein